MTMVVVPVLLDVHDFWRKPDTISVTSIAGIISTIMRKVIKEILKTVDKFHFQTYIIKSILQFFKVTSTRKLFFAIK